LILLLWNRQGVGNPALPRNDRQVEKSPSLDSRAEFATTGEPISESPPPAPEPQPVQVNKSSTAAPPPDYESEDFTHVPAWMPRPANAVSARAEDASLRSDGFVEGTLRFAFRKHQAGALHDITDQLKAAGMKADADGFTYASETPPRHCEVRAKNTPGGAIMVSLSYQGTDHDKGCRCPTCGNSPENPPP
jgi:hypothetical protein